MLICWWNFDLKKLFYLEICLKLPWFTDTSGICFALLKYLVQQINMQHKPLKC